MGAARGRVENDKCNGPGDNEDDESPDYRVEPTRSMRTKHTPKERERSNLDQCQVKDLEYLKGKYELRVDR